MAEYLSSVFGIDLKDAYALAWSGLSDSNTWKNAPLDFQFMMSDGRSITKQETINLSDPYKETEAQFAKGEKICK